MYHRCFDIKVRKISLVDSPAIRKGFIVVKRKGGDLKKEGGEEEMKEKGQEEVLDPEVIVEPPKEVKIVEPPKEVKIEEPPKRVAIKQEPPKEEPPKEEPPKEEKPTEKAKWDINKFLDGLKDAIAGAIDDYGKKIVGYGYSPAYGYPAAAKAVESEEVKALRQKVSDLEAKLAEGESLKKEIVELRDKLSKIPVVKGQGPKVVVRGEEEQSITETDEYKKSSAPVQLRMVLDDLVKRLS